jgi:hypothetical protein
LTIVEINEKSESTQHFRLTGFREVRTSAVRRHMKSNQKENRERFVAMAFKIIDEGYTVRRLRKSKNYQSTDDDTN